jgi:hypothetical protein
MGDKEIDLEDKLRERISLLMRFFSLEDLSKIGNELGLPYFRKFLSYWDINQYQAATEIAKSIDDEKLLKLTRRFILHYSLRLGGFHGKYYTATERAHIACTLPLCPRSCPAAVYLCS